MISFITYHNIPQQLEVILDDEGIEDMILYLRSIQKSKDHMHLIIDSEIDPYPLPEKSKALYAKYVKLEFAGTNNWEVIP